MVSNIRSLRWPGRRLSIWPENPDGSYFLSARGGFGEGGAFQFNSNGKSPGWDSCKKYTGVGDLGIGAYAEAAVAWKTFYGGLTANAGVNFNIDTLPDYSPYLGTPQLEYGLDIGWGLRGVAAAGVEVTIF